MGAEEDIGAVDFRVGRGGDGLRRQEISSGDGRRHEGGERDAFGGGEKA